MTILTPVQRVADYFLKREDLHEVNGVNGCKVREAQAMVEAGCRHLIGYGGRRSTTAAAMAAVGRHTGTPVMFHTASGGETVEMRFAEKLGAKVVRHTPGYLTVVRSRAALAAKKRNVPCGLAHSPAIAAIAAQTANLTTKSRRPARVVLAVGGGVVLAGVVAGLMASRPIPVLGVVVGAPPDRDFLTVHARGWEQWVTFVTAEESYQTEVTAMIGDVPLDPLYEAKTTPYLQAGDLLWVSGLRNS